MNREPNPAELKNHVLDLEVVKMPDGTTFYKSVCSCDKYESREMASPSRAMASGRRHRDILSGYK